ncbi:hypothetical protein ACIQPQ_33640 [Streptomyces sp. NPDC091281]|uniref:hypothetical protein n=1 Tax=Streptomyces sp. NPDC091281 TaxID=3365985 RepID=UPI00381685A9
MSGRPRDWHPVADSDPVPGDPDQVAKLGRTLRKTADELERQIRNLKAVAEVDAWDNKSGKEFRSRAKGNVKKLEAAFKRYDAAAEALGTSVTEVGGGYQDHLHADYSNYASDLNRAQAMADAARKEARDADERRGAAQKSLDGLADDKSGTGSPDQENRKKAEARRDAASEGIDAARQKIDEARRVRNEAAKRARDSIDAIVNHDSLKDGFWDTLVRTVTKATETIAKWAGILSLVVGWIPVIGQALAGVLGAIAMIATLINIAATLVAVLQGNEEWGALGKAAIGLLMIGVGKAFSLVAGRFVKVALPRLGRAGSARTSNQMGRAAKKLNKISSTKYKLTMDDAVRSLREPFTEPFSKAAWANNLKVLKPGSGSYGKSADTLKAVGSGSRLMGIGKSFSAADPAVAAELKAVKHAAQGIDLAAANRISKKATALSLTGVGITGSGYLIDHLMGD